jgi:two-component system phosphate regulon sensor histidine kinase PhoR
MGLSFAALLYLQVRYSRQMLRMRKEQFAESVSRSMNIVSRNMELEQTVKGLEKYIKDNNADALQGTTKEDTTSMYTGAFPLDIHAPVAGKKIPRLHTLPHPVTVPKGFTLKKRIGNSYSSLTKEMRNLIKNQYLNQRELLDRVVVNILNTSNNQPLSESINFKMLDQSLKAEFESNGIDLEYHFTVTTSSGKELYRCPDYDPKGEKYSFKQILMPHNAPANTAILTVHFPEMHKYLYSSVKFLIPSIIFIIILLLTFIFTIYISFRQKKLSEMKNDFVNNMTHELKTPVSSISLAVQMLLDPNVPKSEKMTKHLSTVISDETKRLRMLIDVVLQTSIFEGRKIRFNQRNIKTNKLVNDVVSTFSIKAKKEGGSLEKIFDAAEDCIYADEMHMTNVLFNIMDNAYKYRRKDVDFNLQVKTWNEGDNICISIKDNGIGIKHDDLKKIFDKFYRVHTGNRHDVKGFGLGLAYVKNIIDLHHGTISTESELGKGTTFVIKLPIIKE